MFIIVLFSDYLKLVTCGTENAWR